VDVHGSAHINLEELLDADGFVDGVKDDLQKHHGHKLLQTLFTEDLTHGNQDLTLLEVTGDQTADVQVDFGPVVLELAVEEPVHQDGVLDGDLLEEEVKGNRTVGIPLHEGHQETETDEDHHMHILEHGIVLGDGVGGLLTGALGLLDLVIGDLGVKNDLDNFENEENYDVLQIQVPLELLGVPSCF